MNRTWRLILPAVLGGLLAGVWLGARCERAASRRMRREGPKPEYVLKMFRRHLNLRSDQVEPVQKILESKRPQFQAVRREEVARMSVLRTEIDKEITPLLDAAQKSKLSELRARWEKRMMESSPPDAR